MVDASYTPDEPGSEAVPEVVLNESAHESAVEIVEGNDSEESSILETQSEDEGPYVDADTSPISSEDAPAEATTVEPEGVANADQDFTESARNPDGTLPFAPEVETTGPAEENASDWDLGELETTADAVDAAKLAMQRNAAGNRPMQQLWALVQPGLKLWQRLLRGARSRLPQVAALSDRVLSGILIGIFVLLLIVINRLGQPSPAAVTLPTPSASAAATAPPATAQEALKGEAMPVNPGLERLVDIQAQLSAVATSYASNLVVSVQANFTDDRLTANLSSGWYRLPRDQQDRLAADLLGRSQSLEFTTLELSDPDGAMVARSPVVGQAMVIVQRQPPPEVPVPERPRYRITIDR